MTAMSVEVTAVQFNGNQADATVSFAPKGASPTQGMSMQYHLEQQNNKWVVVGRKDAGGSPHAAAEAGAVQGGANPHGGGMPPGVANPHGGGGMGAPGGSGMMPSPKDLPPATKKQ